MTWATAAAVVALGVFHGLNPAMGWLFAVALGFHERGTAEPAVAGVGAGAARGAPGRGGAGVPRDATRSGAAAPASGAAGVAGPGRGRRARGPRPARVAVLRALPPIAAGHLASVAVVAVAFAVTQSVVASRTVAIGGGAVLVALGLWRLLSARHFRWVGMRLSAWELGTWSFLMSSVHGAGLMLVPVLAHHTPLPPGASAATALAASTLHTVAMLATAGAVALLVTEVLGLAVLRRAWIDVDRIWATALIAAGLATVLLI